MVNHQKPPRSPGHVRRGKSRIGCLFSLLLIAVLAYVGVQVGNIYFRYYAFEDQMRQQARFASQLTDSAIRRNLSFSADSLGLPPAVHDLQIVRSGRTIVISTAYAEVLDLRVYTRHFRFSPRVTGDY